jgi:N-acetylmuramoyl-L-alanine amidase CwlA
MEIIKAHAVKNLCYTTAHKMVPKGVVVHSTGANNPMLKRYVDAPDKVGVNLYGNHWNCERPEGRMVCVHAFIGYDDEHNVKVAEILPLDICCWGVGSGSKGSYNYSPAYIQFEICEDGLNDKEYYEKAFVVAAEYTAHLCRTYNLPIENVVSHKEAHEKGYGCNHADPDHWMKNFGETMDDFRKKVSELLKNGDDKKASEDASDDDYIPRDGDLVSIKSGATYYNGKTIPEWVQKQKWYVRGNSSTDRIVVDKNEKMTNSIRSPIHRKFLKVEKYHQ